MSCYLRHLRDVFEELGLDYDPPNRARVDDAVRAVLSVDHDATCPQVWGVVKALPNEGAVSWRPASRSGWRSEAAGHGGCHSIVGYQAGGRPTRWYPGGVDAPVTRESLIERLGRFFAERSDVAAAYLFGSAVGDRFGPMSDVDVAVLAKHDIAGDMSPDSPAPIPPELTDLQLELAGRLPSLVGGRRVDVLMLNRAPVRVAFPAVHEGRLLSGSDSTERVLFEVDLLRRYTDYRPVIREYQSALRARIERGEFLGR